MRLSLKYHDQSQETNWRHCVTGPELPLFHKRKGIVKIDQSVKMPWHRLCMRVASPGHRLLIDTSFLTEGTTDVKKKCLLKSCNNLGNCLYTENRDYLKENAHALVLFMRHRLDRKINKWLLEIQKERCEPNIVEILPGNTQHNSVTLEGS